GGNASPNAVLGDPRQYSAPEDQAVRLRRLAVEVEVREQRQRQAQEQQELKQQHIRSLQSNLHRRPGQQLAPVPLDPGFYGAGGQDDYHQHGQLGMAQRGQQQQQQQQAFMPGGGPGGLLPRRPLSRDSHDMRTSPHGYRDQQQQLQHHQQQQQHHQQQQQQQQRGYGGGNPSPYGFLPHMNNNSHGYGPAAAAAAAAAAAGGGGGGDSDVPSAPVAGVLGGRANLRPPQPRISVAQPRARRPLPPSPGRGGVSGTSSMSGGIMEGGSGAEAGRQGGSLSPFVGHQPSPHLRLPLPPVMPGSFAPPFQALDWYDG
ncbi:unnamed protein product, partial [Laminaria digitata]